MSYCVSRFHTVRRRTIEVKVGSVGVGGSNPLRVQSMTTSDTQDIAATVRQAIALAEVGCEIVRITAPNVAAAKCLKDIRTQFSAAGFAHVPLVADIHFLPAAAMEAVEHVEKVRVNPGNYADKKKFAVKEYSDSEYDDELQRLHEAFTPLVLRARELGRALRIGTNHGSLSDRIMNRYGDTPLGMVESALEFLRIGRSHGFHQMILSMKSSNPKVMIQAYRLLVERMRQEDMHYPLHLGVTEAGDGEDGRIKSAIGIGSLLTDGLGDTLRVSLTEDSVYEIPVAQALARRAEAGARDPATGAPRASAANHHQPDAIDPFAFTKRATASLEFSSGCAVGPELPPRTIVRAPSAERVGAVLKQLSTVRLGDTPLEGLLVPLADPGEAQAVFAALSGATPTTKPAFVVLELPDATTPEAALTALPPKSLAAPPIRTGTEVDAGTDTDADTATGTALGTMLGVVLLRRFTADDAESLAGFAKLVRSRGLHLAIATTDDDLALLAPILRQLGDERFLFTVADAAPPSPLHAHDHAVGRYRALSDALRLIGSHAPLWIRNTTAIHRLGGTSQSSFLERLLDASVLTGSLLCDGLGDLMSVETEPDPTRALKLAYNILQGAGARITKTEFVACPSCGRTLFDLQTTTQRIRAQTGHLKGVKLAIMGCIVNGPGEMADADFGYVGGAPGKINLYVGKQCVQYNIPQSEADARLIALIKEHGRWSEPDSSDTGKNM